MLPEIITIRKATNLIGTLFQTKIGSTRDTCFLRHHFQCYREGQEDQLGALGLVTNSVVLWNSLYMQEALSHLRSTGETPEDKHIARLSPLMHGHINMLGHYTFTLPEDILKGELRSLNFNLNNELSS